MDLQSRFMAKVEKQPSGCWLWIGAKGGGTCDGYGHFIIANKVERAHRVSYQLFVGRIIDIPGTDYRGTCVIHSCDNRLCVNPEHLRLGTHNDNMADKKNRGRVVCNPLLGEAHQNSKLTEGQVRDMRRMALNGISPSQIAKRFTSVSSATVRDVLAGRTWTHLREGV